VINFSQTIKTTFANLYGSMLFDCISGKTKNVSDFPIPVIHCPTCQIQNIAVAIASSDERMDSIQIKAVMERLE